MVQRLGPTTPGFHKIQDSEADHQAENRVGVHLSHSVVHQWVQSHKPEDLVTFGENFVRHCRAIKN